MREDKRNKAGIRNPSTGTLYMVATPIGNLEDITLRALKVLKQADLIAAESVRHSRGLCRHYGITTRLTSYNQHNRSAKGPELVRHLKSGRDVALVTSAGVPGVSDPGVYLAARALAEGIRICPIPGPSSVTAALSVSGMRSDSFLFLGFLSSRPGKRRKELRALGAETRTMVLFEAPHRLEAMLRDVEEILGNREVVVLREMTKVYEEVIRGPVRDVLSRLKDHGVRGEFTLVIGGGERDGCDSVLPEKVQERAKILLRQRGATLKDVATRISTETGFNYREIYKKCLALKRGTPLGSSKEPES